MSGRSKVSAQTRQSISAADGSPCSVERVDLDAVRAALQVVAALGRDGEDRREDGREGYRDDRRVGLERAPRPPKKAAIDTPPAISTGAEAHRVDVVEHAATELGHHRRELSRYLLIVMSEATVTIQAMPMLA